MGIIQPVLVLGTSSINRYRLGRYSAINLEK